MGAGGEGDNRGWDGWMASATQCTWVWVNSGSWWWTGRPGAPWLMWLQRVRYDWAPELNWTEPFISAVWNLQCLIFVLLILSNQVTLVQDSICFLLFFADCLASLIMSSAYFQVRVFLACHFLIITLKKANVSKAQICFIPSVIH